MLKYSRSQKNLSLRLLWLVPRTMRRLRYRTQRLVLGSHFCNVVLNCLLLFSVSLLLFSPLLVSAADLDRPNILLIFADDQRADTIASLGNSVIKTP
ncbi:MAG: hypothetical protein FJ267_12125, partial [Planctomycetes bacterium]|nr:hypothetical protein [Planctomycetota bacterium]